MARAHGPGKAGNAVVARRPRVGSMTPAPTAATNALRSLVEHQGAGMESRMTLPSAPFPDPRAGLSGADRGSDLPFDAVLAFGVDGTIREFNPGAEQLFGWRRDEAVGQAPRREPDCVQNRVAAASDRHESSGQQGRPAPHGAT